MKLKWLRYEEVHMSTAVAFQAYGRILWTVYSFKYLVTVLMAPDYGWPEVVVNLSKAQRRWPQLSRIL